MIDRFINITDGLKEVLLGQGLLDLCLQLLDVIFVLSKLHDIDLAFFDLFAQWHHGRIAAHIGQVSATVAFCYGD